MSEAGSEVVRAQNNNGDGIFVGRDNYGPISVEVVSAKTRAAGRDITANCSSGWRQTAAVVTATTSGMIAGLSFAHGAPATMTAPEGCPPAHLMALEKAAPDHTRTDDGVQARSGDEQLRSAIVNVAKYYLNLSKTRTPAQMEALIWGKDSIDSTDHGPTGAALASLTLELGSQAAGQQSWVSGGSTYPWPVHDWVDSRVDPNPDSSSITSVLTDAEAHGRWHALGDGYQPQPGDWVLFNEQVAVVTSYSRGVLDTIGADSPPNNSVNAHTYSGSLADQGITGFVDNGGPSSIGFNTTDSPANGDNSKNGAAPHRSAVPSKHRQNRTGQVSREDGRASRNDQKRQSSLANIPGVAPLRSTAAPSTPTPAANTPKAAPQNQKPQANPASSQPSQQPEKTRHQAVPPVVTPEPGPPNGSTSQSGGSSNGKDPGQKCSPQSSSETSALAASKTYQAFINSVVPGAIAAQQRWGVPASVMIAQAIEESDWGTSELAAKNRNLFNIEGSGPAGTIHYLTQKLEDGRWITVDAPFRAYHTMAESISDHAEFLATSGHYAQAMANRHVPNAFADALTGAYGIDPSPDYGSNLIATMKLYDLYRYDTATSSAPQIHQAARSYVAPANQTSASSGTAAAPSTSGNTAAADGPDIPGLKPSTTPSAKPTVQYLDSEGLTLLDQRAAELERLLQSMTLETQLVPPSPRATALLQAIKPGTRPVSSAQPTATAARYTTPMPSAVTTAYSARAKTPVGLSESLYKAVADQAGISWELLAACDWAQCQSDPRRSPVHGEKLGTVNRDGSKYLTKPEALAQCASDMIELAGAIYGVDITDSRPMPVRALAEVFAAYRWGGLLKKHGVSAMEFPYSVAGLTGGHTKMRWPSIDGKCVLDKPGSRFKQPFGAVPVVLSLEYPATVLRP